MSTHNTCNPDVKYPEFKGFRDINESRISPKSRTMDYYLYLIEPYFDSLEVFSTEGDFRTPYQFQWVAYSKTLLNDDAPYDGVGGTPLAAVRDLYNNMRKVLTPERRQSR